MELRVLNYFLMVAREENMTKAAQQLHLTQPTLSRQIAQLEDELGVKLFHRGKHSVFLTEDGMILKRRAQELLSLAEKTKADFLHHEEDLAGQISIGSGEFKTSEILAELIHSFREKYPKVRFEIYSGNADNIRDYIERGLLDLGLMSEPVDIRKYDFAPMPIKEVWGALVQKDSKLAQKETIRPEDLLDAPLIIPAGNFNHSNIGKWFGEYSNQLEIVASGNLIYNMAMLADRSVGALIGIELNNSYEHLRFIPLNPPLETGSAMAWKKDQIFNPVTSAFIEHVKQTMG